MKLFCSFFLINSIVFTQIPNQKEKTFSNFILKDSKVSIGLSFYNFDNSIVKNYFTSIWLSDNLSISSSFSSNISDSDVNLYYNHSIAYHPLMFNNNNIDSYFNFSMHRMRFYEGKSYRWYDYGISSNINYNNHKIILSWHYITEINDKYFFNFYYKKLIYNRMNILLGSKLFRENKKFIFQPNIKLIFNL